MTSTNLTSVCFTLPDDDPETWQTRLRLVEWEAMGQAVEPAPPSGVLLAFEAKGENPPALTVGELAHARWFLDHNEKILETALEGLLSAYPGLVGSFGYNDDERSRWMPDIGSIKDLKPLVRPTAVTIHTAERDGLPYLGVLFDCTWDPEHGTGALLHGVRVVVAGEADHARDGDMAAEDAILTGNSD